MSNSLSIGKLTRTFRALCVPAAFVLLSASGAFAQAGPGVGVTVDSLHVTKENTDSLLRADSVEQELVLRNERRLEHSRQLATQRTIDLTNDGVPEVLRLDGKLDKHVDDTKLYLTIRSGKKVLFKDSWTAKGYFDTIDHLSDSVKIKRLRRIVAVAFANENFTVFDSSDFVTILKNGSPDEVQPGSVVARELLSTPRVMYSVFRSREYWYGLVWLPSQKRFVKAWRN